MDKTPALINTEKETRSFFWFMTLILISVSVWIILEQSELRQLRNLIPFCILMIVHILLHWMLRKFSDKTGWTLGYMLVQGVLMVGMIFITRNIGLTLGLSMALVGEAIGVYGVSKRGFLVSAFHLTLSLGAFIWLSGFSQIKWWLVALIPMIIFVVVYVEMYSRQAKANEQAQELLNELEVANRKLTDYAAQVEDLTITAERQRLARELHDTLSQGLAGMILQLEAADANLSNGKTEKTRQILHQTMESARATLSNARLAIDDLRQTQPSVHEGSLRETIQKFESETGIPCKLDGNLPQGLAASITETIVRVTAEALANIARHAHAKQVIIRQRIEKNELVFEIIDKGKGFDPSAIPPTGHYGLIGMEERTKLTGGKFQLISQPGHGTAVTLRIPLS